LDELTISMQNEAIRIAEERLGHSLTESLIQNIRLGGWSYMGLEAIIDTVRTIELHDLERYLRDLKK